MTTTELITAPDLTALGPLRPGRPYRQRRSAIPGT